MTEIFLNPDASFVSRFICIFYFVFFVSLILFLFMYLFCGKQERERFHKRVKLFFYGVSRSDLCKDSKRFRPIISDFISNHGPILPTSQVSLYLGLSDIDTFALLKLGHVKVYIFHGFDYVLISDLDKLILTSLDKHFDEVVK